MQNWMTVSSLAVNICVELPWTYFCNCLFFKLYSSETLCTVMLQFGNCFLPLYLGHSGHSGNLVLYKYLSFIIIINVWFFFPVFLPSQLHNSKKKSRDFGMRSCAKYVWMKMPTRFSCPAITLFCAALARNYSEIAQYAGSQSEKL